MLSAHEQLSGTRDKLIPSYWVEGGGFSKLLPFDCGLRKARKLAQEWANKWNETVHLTVRIGYGKPKYVSGQALYYPQTEVTQ